MISKIGIVFFLLPFFVNALEFSASRLTEIFGSQLCIPGSLSTIQLNIPNPMFVKTNSLKEKVLNISNEKIVDASNSITKLNEVAQFNGLKYFYKLEKEEGPAHEKVFTLSLTLGDEKYEGQGKSLKAAKQYVAALALLGTQYESPPVKEKDKNIDSLTPTVLLNNLSTKLGIEVTYELVDKERQVLSDTGSSSNKDVKQKKSYFQKLNDSINSTGLHIKKDLPQDKGPFQVKVKVGDKFFYGFAHSIKAAKHEAASIALDYLIQNKDNLNSPCQNEGSEEECKQARQSMKSPVSIVHEAAQARKINVEFEIIDEQGPAHKKTFITKCTLGELTSTGEGRSKKESKKAAAQNMLERISELEPISQEVQVNSMMKDKKKKKKKKKKIIKTKFDEISMMAGDLIESVLGTNKDEQPPQITDNAGDDDITKPKSKKHGDQRHSYQNELLDLSNSLNFDIQYSDFSEGGKQYSLLSLLIDPEYICFGKGADIKNARDLAAQGGLKIIFKLGLYDHFQGEKFSSLERDVADTVNVLLREDVKQDKDEL